MKKITIVILFSLCLLLCGCGGSDVPEAVDAPPAEEATIDYSTLRLNELMTDNTATLLKNGSLPDWIELYNDSDSSLSLEGLVLSDGSHTCVLPELSVEGKGVLLLLCGDGEGEVPFSLSENDTLTLSAPDGTVLSSCDCAGIGENCSLRFSEGVYEVSRSPSPGFPNTEEGYESYRLSLKSQSPLCINEVFAHGSEKQNTTDWVELCNTGDAALTLSDYCLSDKADHLGKLRLPDVTLEKGELYLCSLGGDTFSLDDETEQLYLSCEEEIVDCVCLRGIPACGSIGRENGQGWYYYAVPSPLEENRDGFVQVAEAPLLVGQDGVFAPGESVTVELSGEGSIYYTTDCSHPSADSTLYTGPITLTKDTVLRAVSVADGKLDSSASCYSFFFTDVSLPVVSLIGDEPEKLDRLKRLPSKIPEIPGVLSLYEEDDSFTVPCGIRLSGNSSVKLNSKSFKVYFRSCFGASSLCYDVFDNGITNYHSLGLRRGYDSYKAMFRNELFETLARSFTDLCPVQSSKFCRAYINGEYWGIVSLRDDFSPTFFSENYGGKKSSVEYFKFPVDKHNSFYSEVLTFCIKHRDEGEYVYEQLKDTIDMDSLIDWIIVKGYFGDVDYFPNVACYRSNETGYRWRFALWDFDLAPISPFQNMVIGSSEELHSPELSAILTALCSSETFRERFVTRLAEAVNGPFRSENVLALIDSYEELLQEEVPVDHKQWNMSPYSWSNEVEHLRTTYSDPRWRQQMIAAIRRFPHFEDMDLSVLEE